MNSSVINLSEVSAQEKSEIIVGIWKSVLTTDKVGTNEEFFDLGGNSMLLLAMLEMVQEKFDKEIALEFLTDGVTIDLIANLLQ